MVCRDDAELCGKSVQQIPAQPPAGISPFRVLAAISMLAIGVSILAFAMSDNVAANRDFISYWAAAHQFVHHKNPYDGPAILQLEQSAGFPEHRPFFMRNLPSAYFMALPLGFVGAKTGAVLWSCALTATLLLSIRMLWILHGRPPDRLHLIGYVFPPAMACLFAGQTGIFLLFGVTLFLYLHASRPYFAGLALLVCAFKPHLFLPFGTVLLAWIVVNRSYRILIGACAGLFMSVGVAWFLYRPAWSQYARMMNAANLNEEFIPTVSLVFRLLIARNATWLQFVPAFIASGLGFGYFWVRRKQWSWMTDGLLLLLISVLVAPYAWFTDEVVLLPAILAGIYRQSNSERSLLPFLGIAGAALIEVFIGCKLNSGLYLWTAPAWLAWYLSTLRRQEQLALN